MNLRDVLGEKRGKDVEEEIGYAIEQIRGYGWKDLRSMSEFLSVFKVPQMHKKNLEQRIITNFLHYRSNYIAICIGLFLLRIIFAPFLLLSITCVIAFSMYLLVVINKPIVLGDFTISENGKRVTCAVISLIFLAMCGALERLLWTMLYSIVLCVLHMVFRPRSVTSKSGKLYDELKLTGFSWFGGENTTPEIEDPESAIGSNNEDVPFHLGMTSASVRKRTALGPTVGTLGAGKNI